MICGFEKIFHLLNTHFHAGQCLNDWNIQMPTNVCHCLNDQISLQMSKRRMYFFDCLALYQPFYQTLLIQKTHLKITIFSHRRSRTTIRFSESRLCFRCFAFLAIRPNYSVFVFQFQKHSKSLDVAIFFSDFPHFPRMF